MAASYRDRSPAAMKLRCSSDGGGGDAGGGGGVGGVEVAGWDGEADGEVDGEVDGEDGAVPSQTPQLTGQRSLTTVIGAVMLAGGVAPMAAMAIMNMLLQAKAEPARRSNAAKTSHVIWPLAPTLSESTDWEHAAFEHSHGPASVHDCSFRMGAASTVDVRRSRRLILEADMLRRFAILEADIVEADIVDVRRACVGRLG